MQKALDDKYKISMVALYLSSKADTHGDMIMAYITCTVFTAVAGTTTPNEGRFSSTILRQTDKGGVRRLKVLDYTFIEYHELDEREAWMVGLGKELTDAKFRTVNIENMNYDEGCNTLNYICTS